MSRPTRVLVVAHGHPNRSPGGGEIAARNLHLALQAEDDFESVLLARSDAPQPAHQGTPFWSAGTRSEVLMQSHTRDRFGFSQADDARVWRDFRDVLETFQPEIVHFHHYLHLGLELLGEVKRYAAGTRVLLTLHDYMAICHQQGQMIHSRTNALCHEASPEACSRCFKHYNPQDFDLRKHRVQTGFAQVDQFISPSQFLADRYVRWGLAPERMTVIENLLDNEVDRLTGREPGPLEPARIHDADVPGKKALQLAYFGRVAHTKGVDILLQAMQRLPPGIQQQVSLDIHGAGLDRLPWTDKRRLRSLARPLGQRVRFQGAYEPHEMPGLMVGVDWMVVPSRWWENSPVVILEAKRSGVPVICSDIGGMAEKIRHGDTGLHFSCGSAEALAAIIVQAASLGTQRDGYAARIKADYKALETCGMHLALHRQWAPERTPDRPQGTTGSNGVVSLRTAS